MIEWAPAKELAQCKRCGKTGKVPKGSRRHGRHIFCSMQCHDWYRQEVRWQQRDRENARRAMLDSEHYAVLARTPMHELYPGMLKYLDMAQRARPSWERWARL